MAGRLVSEGSTDGSVLAAATEPATGGEAVAADTFGGVGGVVALAEEVNVVVVDEVDVLVVVVVDEVQLLPLTVWCSPYAWTKGGPVRASAWRTPQKLGGYLTVSSPVVPVTEPTTGLPTTFGSLTKSTHLHPG